MPATRGYGAQPRYDRGGSAYYRGPTYIARRPVFVQPYYYFRPHLTLSFGFHVGYGVAYPWARWDPYGFYNYGIAVHSGYGVGNYYSRVGGVSFTIDPWGAAVYVDNHYAGVAADFGPDQMPLTLPAGRHRIDLRAEGFRSVHFDVTVVPGQVIPYEGTLDYDYDRY